MPLEPAPASGRPLRAIAVDEDPITVELIRFLLERSGWQVDWAASYARALMLLAAVPADLVVVAIDLPVGDGAGFCATARRLHTGLIIATSRAAESQIPNVGLATGADEHLIKPLDASEFLARVQALQRRRAWQQEAHHSRRSGQ